MKKILLVAGGSRVPTKWGWLADVSKEYNDDPNIDYYYLDCHGNIKTQCDIRKFQRFGYCEKCYKNCLAVVKEAGVQDDHILVMENFKAPEFPKFSSIKELLDFEFEGYKYGLGPASTTMSITQDGFFDIKKHNKMIGNLLKTEYVIFKNLEKYQEIYQFDELHVFNGRFSSMYPVVSFAQKHNIHYVTHEWGGKLDKRRVIDNDVVHNFYLTKREIKEYWENGPENKTQIAIEWYNNRNNPDNLTSYTKKQTRGLLPKNWDTTKENITFFNTSSHEIGVFESWNHPFVKEENEILKGIFEHYKDDETKHFYLRIHPNLKKGKKKNSKQLRGIKEFKKYKNVTVIQPKEKIDSYALIKNSSKIICSYSSVGCEATYFGTPSIIAGKAVYEDCDCAYKANSFEELFQLIDTKDLKPKPKENALPYAFYSSELGFKYKYFQVKTLWDGTFMNLRLTPKGAHYVKK